MILLENIRVVREKIVSCNCCYLIDRKEGKINEQVSREIKEICINRND